MAAHELLQLASRGVRPLAPPAGVTVGVEMPLEDGFEDDSELPGVPGRRSRATGEPPHPSPASKEDDG